MEEQREQDEINPFQTKEGQRLIKKMSFEMKFVSVINLIYGILMCLSIFVALIGIPVMFSSIKAIDSASNFQKFSKDLTAESLFKAVSQLRTYFQVQFWIFVIMIVISLIIIIFFATFISNMVNEFKDTPIFS